MRANGPEAAEVYLAAVAYHQLPEGVSIAMKRIGVALALLLSSALVALVGQALLFAGAATPDGDTGPARPAVQRVMEVQHAYAGSHGPLLRLIGDEDEAFVAFRESDQPAAAVLWLSGVDGGLDGPFDGFYSLLAEQLQHAGLASAQLLYRSPGEFEASVREALLALAFLEQQGIQNVALVGFSFGGAVAIEVAAANPKVATVVTLASQEYGTDRVAEIAPRPLLVVHAEGDEVMPVSVARSIYERAGPDKKLVVLPTSDHYLTDASPRVERLIRRWLLRNVAPPAEPRSAHA